MILMAPITRALTLPLRSASAARDLANMARFPSAPSPMFNLLTHPICLSAPRLSGSPSSSIEHLPFLMLLVDLIRPRTLVELGTREGVSYCALCQAVDELKLQASCHAVGAWANEESPELVKLRAHHEPLYGRFSRLWVGASAEAGPTLAEGSVDLLLLRGASTLEAARRDFEAWRPRMSRSGVVLLLGIQGRLGGPGPRELWGELASRSPSLAFEQAEGLGVLAVGQEVPEGLRPLLELRGAEASFLQALLFELGARLSLARQQQLANALFRTQETEQRQLRAETQRLSEALNQKTAELSRSEALVAELRGSLQVISASMGWKLINRYWALRESILPPNTRRGDMYQKGKLLLRKVARRRPGASAPAETAPASPASTPTVDRQAQYTRWVEQNTPTPADLERMRQGVASLAHQPLISIVTPVYDVDEEWLRKAVESVMRQVYPNWQLCLVDDGSKKPHIGPLLRAYAEKDSRIKTVRQKNGGISAASNTGLRMAEGEFVAFMDHDDELAPEALYEVVRRLNVEPDLDLIYSDEDKLDLQGRRETPFFKPDWSPDLLLSMNYICHLTVARKRLLDEVGGFRSVFDGSQDHDLLLRVTERTQRIAHIPQVLYHWRNLPQSTAVSFSSKPYTIQAARKALEEALERRGREGSVLVDPRGFYAVRYKLQDQPRISIIIPTKDKVELLKQCIDSIRARSSYPNYELLVVNNNSTEPATFEYFSKLPAPHRVLTDSRPFNWAAINNAAAAQATGDYLLFLNNDVEVLTPDWLEAMLEHAQRPEVGAVGARLLFPNNTLQHAGVVMGIGGVAGHAFKLLGDDQPSYIHQADVIRNYSAVTGACMMVRRTVFQELGGFDEQLRVAFNDVDFCLRMRERGYLIVYTPYAKLYHFESATRGTLHPPEDDLLMRERWARVLRNGDPYYNPNLTLKHEDFSLKL